MRSRENQLIMAVKGRIGSIILAKKLLMSHFMSAAWSSMLISNFPQTNPSKL